MQPSFLWIYWTSSYLNLVMASKKSLIFKGFLLSTVVACHQLTHAAKEHLCALVNNEQHLLMSGMARPGLYNFAETNSFRSRSERNTEL